MGYTQDAGRRKETSESTGKSSTLKVQIQHAQNNATEDLGHAIKQWTELVGPDSPITQTQLTAGIDLQEIEQHRQHLRELSEAADISRDCLRILGHPTLSMMLGPQRANALEQRTHQVIRSIAMTTRQQEQARGIQELRNVQAELNAVERRLQQSLNLLSEGNRAIDRQLMRMRARSEPRTETSQTWIVSPVEHHDAIAYTSAQELARLRYQARQATRSQDQMSYAAPVPPLALADMITAEPDVALPDFEPIPLVLRIEGAAYGFRAWLIAGDTEPLRLRILPVFHEQVVQLGKQIRTAITWNPERFKYYVPGKEFSEAELQNDWKVLAEMGSAVLKAIFDEPALELLEKHLRPPIGSRDHPPVSMRIETEGFFLPWEMLAWPARSEDEPLASRFWGFLYNITRSVIDAEKKITKPRLAADTRPDMLFFTLQEEDPQFLMVAGLPTPLNLTRVEEWDPDDRENEIKDLEQYLAKPLHVVHFGCHAKGAEHEENAEFEVNKGFDLKLHDFIDRKCKLLGNPLVFLNACATGIFGGPSRETLTTSEDHLLAPKVAADFVRVFLRDLGACGVIATEYEIPTNFAPEFAREFYTRFLGGAQSAGEALLQARQELLRKRHNPLGLFFSAYLEPATRISIIHSARSTDVNLASHTFITVDGSTMVRELTSAFSNPPEFIIVLLTQSSAALGYLPFGVLTMAPPDTTLSGHPALQVSKKDQVLPADVPNDSKERAIANCGLVILTKQGAPVKILTPETLGEEFHLPVTLTNTTISSGMTRELCPRCKEPAERVVMRIKGRFIHYCSNCAQEWK